MAVFQRAFLFDGVSSVSAIHIPFLGPGAAPDLSDTEIVQHWAIASDGGCSTLVGLLEGLPACVELRSLNVDRGYARLRDGGVLRLGKPAT